MIAIIAILAAILFPVFAQAREKARQAACMSNEKQIGTSVMMYMQDYDEVYPSVDLNLITDKVSPALPLPDNRTFIGRMQWPLQLYPYIKSQQVFICPDDDLSQQYWYGSGTGTYTGTYNKPIPMSYGINESMFFFGSKDGGGYGATYTSAASLADVKFPSSTYYIGDVSSYSSPTWGQGSQDITQYSTFNRLRFARPCGTLQLPVDGNGGTIKMTGTASDMDKCTRHNGGNTIIFTDGHAKYMKWSQYLATQANWKRTTD